MDFFTGKPNVEGLGYAFLMRNYRSELGKWQTADPLGYPDGWNNLAYCNNWVTNYIDKLGTDITHLLDPNGGIGGSGHSGWIIGNDQAGYTTYNYGSDSGSGSSGGSGSTESLTFNNFSDALGYLNSSRPPDGQFTQGQTLPTTSADDTVANWAASQYMNGEYSLTEHNCYQLGNQVIDSVNSTNGTNYDISDSIIPNTAFAENNNLNWNPTAVTE